MVSPKAADTPGDFAGRLALAIEQEDKSPTRVAREAGLPAGYIFKLLGTATKAKQIFAPGPDVIRQLADYLHVGYEWLAIGRGPMRASTWAASPLEQAILFARTQGTREDAIAAATERYRDAGEMDAWDWVRAIDAEASLLNRRGVPRPELVAKEQAKHRRLHAQKQRAEAPAAPPPTTHTRAATRRGA